MRDLLYNFLVHAGESFGFDAMARGGEGLGDLLWRTLPSRRELAVRNIGFHLEMAEPAARALAHESFRHNCRSFMEIMLTRRLDWHFARDRLEIVNPENMRELSGRRTPAVGITAHLGAWELLVGMMHLFIERPERNVVVRRVSDAALNRIMLRQRTRPGTAVIEHRKAVFPVLRTLKKGGMSAFLVDHNCTRSEAVFLPFLRDVAAVNAGPALLAVRAEAEVWPVFLIRLDGARYAFHVEEPLATADLKGDRHEKMIQTARFYTEAVERFVRRYPEQWFWMHKRWKTRPAPDQVIP
ncbi:MAG: acyltransferase [Desulfovibrionaceae bacterium]|nr:acyltransferase [Desulfovibrionaceae bacterium]